MTFAITVIVPVYNASAYIDRLVESFYSQTFNDFEVIFIDDGSIDDSYQKLYKYVKSESRFSLFRKENGGVSSARNEGIKHATGNYLYFCDADDVITDNALEEMYKAAEQIDADIVVGQIELNDLGEIISSPLQKRLTAKSLIAANDKDFLWTFSLCNKLYKRKIVFENNILFNENISICEDGIFLFDVLKYAVRIAGCNNVVYRYISRPFWEENSLTQKIDERFIKETEAVCNDIAEKGFFINQRTDIFWSEKVSKPGLYKTEEQYRKLYMQLVYRRFIKHNILDTYYKKFWQIKAECHHQFNELLKNWKIKTSEEFWKWAIESQRGISDVFPLISRKRMADKAIFTIFIGYNLDKKRVNEIITSIYQQTFPMFELILDGRLKKHISNMYRNMENLHFVNSIRRSKIKDKAMKCAKGKFVVMIEDEVFFEKNALYKLYDGFDSVIVILSFKLIISLYV